MGNEATETAVDPGTETPMPGPAPTGDVKPDATPEGAAAAEITPAGEDAGGEPPPGEAQPPKSWGTIGDQSYDDAYGALEHPDFQPVLQRRDRDLEVGAVARGREEAQRDFKTEEATTVIDGVSGVIGAALERLGEGNVEGAEKLVDRIGQMVAPYGKTFIETVRENERGKNFGSAAKFFRDVLKEGLPLKAQHELEDFAEKQTSWGPVLKRREELMRPAVEADIERMRESRETKEERAARLAKTKPPVKPEGGGAGGKLTAAQLDKMTPQQVAAQNQDDVDRALAEGT